MCAKIRLLLAVLFALIGVGAQLSAQKYCQIQGRINNQRLRFSKETIEKVYLYALDEYDQTLLIDSAQVVNSVFHFKREVQPTEPILMYLLKGFDNGYVSLFLEEGIVNVDIPEAAFPGGAKVTGTPNNDLYEQYKKISADCSLVQQEYIRKLRTDKGETWLDSEEGMAERLRFGAQTLIECNADRIEFLIKHPWSPLVPLMLDREISPMLDKAYNEKLLNVVSPDLFNHPYYIAYSNAVKAQNLKVGNELPNISLDLLEGGKKRLNDYRGKYVLLDFWASWCAPCLKELPYLKELYKDFGSSDKFTIISFSLDNKEQDWKNAIKNKEIGLPGWIHASDLLGWGSPNAKMCDVTAVPKMILIDPEGKVISFTLRGEELVRRVRQIMDGDIYYLDSKDDKL